MSIQKKIVAGALVSLLVSFHCIQGIVIGSDTAVAVTTVAQAVANTDILNGFTSFVGGITVAAGASAHYNNYFQIYGPITFTGSSGILNLSRNLTLGSNVTFNNGISINGNAFSLNLPLIQTPFVIPSGTVMGNLALVLNSPVQLNAVLTFTNTCVIEGNGNIIDCTLGALAVGAGGNLLIQNATLKGVSNNTFYCYDNNGTVTLENVTCALNNTLTFSQGRLEFLGSNLFTGTQIFFYKSTVPATIHSYATWMFDSGMTFSYATNSNSLIAFDDVTATLKLYETTLYANTPGLRFIKGTVTLDGACSFINDALTFAQGIAIGDGVSTANNVVLNILAESGINIARGFFVDNNV